MLNSRNKQQFNALQLRTQLVYSQPFKANVIIKTFNFRRLYVVKAFDNQIKARQILKKSNSIVKMLSFQRSQAKGVIIQEYFPKGTLKQLIIYRGCFSSVQIKFFLLRMIECCIQMQSLGVFREQLNLKDIFLDSNLKPKLNNFSKSIFVNMSEQFSQFRKKQMQPVTEYLKTIKQLALRLFERWQRVGNKLISKKRQLTEDERGLIQMINQAKIQNLYQLIIHPYFSGTMLIPSRLPQSSFECPPTQKFQKEYLKLGQINQKIETEWKDEFSKLAVVNTEVNRPFHKKVSEGVFQNSIIVKQFIDISNSYGYGYKFSNRSVGFNFNDCTILLMELSKKTYMYRNQEKNVTHYSFQGVIDNQQLRKKTFFINAFSSNLPSSLNIKDGPTYQQSIYITKYVKTKHANLLRFNNGSLQALFSDKTQIFIDKEIKIYFDKQEKESIFKKENPMPDDIEVKLNYVQRLAKVFFQKQ